MEKQNIILSSRKIGEIINKYGLVSNYTVKQYTVQKSKCNEETVENEVARQFDNHKHLEVVVSDPTYVKVQNKWNYVCILLNLANREIIGYSVEKNKNASLVYDAFMKVEGSLEELQMELFYYVNWYNNHTTHGALNYKTPVKCRPE